MGCTHGIIVAGDAEGEFGKWETAYRRYELWVNQGLWPRILQALGEEELPGPVTDDAN